MLPIAKNPNLWFKENKISVLQVQKKLATLEGPFYYYKN